MQKLLETIKSKGLLKSKRVKEVMMGIDRAEFVTEGNPYSDTPQPIGFNATISAPHMHAFALETLAPSLKCDGKALDIGSGSGYMTAALLAMMGGKGRVVGVEHIPELVKQSLTNLSQSHQAQLDQELIRIVEGDGRLGYAEEAPYDCIHIGAKAKRLDPGILDQLKTGGMLLAPIGEGDFQEMVLFRKLPGG